MEGERERGRGGATEGEWGYAERERRHSYCHQEKIILPVVTRKTIPYWEVALFYSYFLAHWCLVHWLLLYVLDMITDWHWCDGNLAASPWQKCQCRCGRIVLCALLARTDLAVVKRKWRIPFGEICAFSCRQRADRICKTALNMTQRGRLENAHLCILGLVKSFVVLLPTSHKAELAVVGDLGSCKVKSVVWNYGQLNNRFHFYRAGSTATSVLCTLLAYADLAVVKRKVVDTASGKETFVKSQSSLEF